MRKLVILFASMGLLTVFFTTLAYADDKEDLTQKYQNMINKAYKNALSSTKPPEVPDEKAAISSGKAALTPTAPNIPSIAAPAEPVAPAPPSPQPPTTAPPVGNVTNPGAASSSYGPPNIFITPGGNSDTNSAANGSKNIIHY